MDEVIITKINHGGTFSQVPVPTYVGNCVPALRYIDKDHFSKVELLNYTEELGYANVADFYYQDLQSKEFVLIESDQHLLHLIKDLKHEDTFEVFVGHVLDEAVVDTDGSAGYLTCKSIDVGEDVAVDDELSDFLSSDSELGDIPLEDGSDIDDELRSFREERRNKKQRKKAVEPEEIPVGEARDMAITNLFVQQDLDREAILKQVLFVLTQQLHQKILKQDIVLTLFILHQLYQNLYSSSQPSSVCSDTMSVPRARQKEVQGGLGRGLGRKKANARGTPFVSETGDSSSQVPPKSSHNRPYNAALFTAATGRNKRPTSGFGVYSDPTTGTQVFNPGTSSEMLLQGPTNLKSASPTNIDIGFKPRGLKWNGTDAVTASQLQQIRANKKKKGGSNC